MKVKMILPALVEARGLSVRPIKYSLFPPLGLATLAGYLDERMEIEIQDEHVEHLRLDDAPDLVVIQVYVTSARRAYEIADLYRRRGSHVCLGGLHVTTNPREALRHADTIFLGPGEDTWPTFLEDFRRGQPSSIYTSRRRSLAELPMPRRDLIQRSRYLVPNSVVVSRGCPHHCSFCYKDTFYEGGKSFYTMEADRALEEIAALPGRHLYFLDDHLFGSPRFVSALFEGMKGMGRVWQAAGTVQTVLERPDLVEKAVRCGLRSLFVGFETLSEGNLKNVSKTQNLGRDYEEAIRRLHGLGVMINASFVYGMDDDGPDVFDRTVDWALAQGLETATFHILTPYPGTALRAGLENEGRILTDDWDRYDTRQAVFRPARMSPAELEAGYRRSYERFYSWKGILQSASTKPDLRGKLRHGAYTAGWKKLEPLWNLVIKSGSLAWARPLLEGVLDGKEAGTRTGRETNRSVLRESWT